MAPKAPKTSTPTKAQDGKRWDSGVKAANAAILAAADDARILATTETPSISSEMKNAQAFFEKDITADDEPDIDLVAMFGPETGLIRLKRIFAMYQRGIRDVPFYKGSKRNIHRCRTNQRRQDSVDTELRSSLLLKGLVLGVGGEAWFCFGPGEVEPFDAVSWGGRTDNMFVLMEDPLTSENEFVKASRLQGVPAARIFTSQMPRKVRRWLRDYHNGFHGGAGHDTS